MMKSVVIAIVLGAWATGTAFAQDPTAAPTRVNESGVYACPSHPEVLATWAARCPACGKVLTLAQPAAALTDIIPADQRDRNREERERAQRDGERGERFRRYNYGYRPYGYVYPRYYGPPAGYQYYPNFGYYYNPSIGIYYYPNTGYYYNPYTGQYFTTPPGYGYNYSSPNGFYFYYGR